MSVSNLSVETKSILKKSKLTPDQQVSKPKKSKRAKIKVRIADESVDYKQKQEISFNAGSKMDIETGTDNLFGT